jgi:hypothetical protein
MDYFLTIMLKSIQPTVPCHKMPPFSKAVGFLVASGHQFCLMYMGNAVFFLTSKAIVGKYLQTFESVD